MKTWTAKDSEVKRQWWIIDAEGKTLGRLATQIATVLRGKNKPIFTPHVDTGDFVVVINSKKIKLTGNKLLQKKYYTHSRFFGSLKEFSAQQILEKDSTFLVTEAVEGMLPNNKLATQILRKLKVYEGAEHPHQIQKPQPLKAEH
jgi:large subunit ribosomal protein L13